MSGFNRFLIFVIQALPVYAGMGLSLECGYQILCNPKGALLFATSFFAVVYSSFGSDEELREYLSKNLIATITGSIFLIIAIEAKLLESGAWAKTAVLISLAVVFYSAYKGTRVLIRRLLVAKLAPAIWVLIGFAIQELTVLMLANFYQR